MPGRLARPARLASGELLIALAVLAFGGLVYWQTLAIPVSPLYARVGPTVIPTLAALGLLGMGAALLIAALRGGWQAQEERETPVDGVALGWVAAGLVANLVLIGPAGFTLASVVMFTLIARGFGSRRPARDAALGSVFALTAYFGFARALGINIGAGPFERMIEALVRGG
jgi:hypothetical protein